MDFRQLIKQYKLVDIITVDDANYALCQDTITVPGCMTILIQQLQNYEKEFLARGFSHKHNAAYSRSIGLEPWLIFIYTLQELPATKKQIFSHALAGTGGRKSLLTNWRGQKIGRNAFFVPKEYETAATTFLNHWRVQYTTEVVLRG